MARSKFYSVRYQGWPPVKILEFEDPDSYHWQNRARDIKHWLILKMGEEQFLEWVERLFPGDTIEQATWKEIFDLYEAKFRVIQGEEREGCTCDHDPNRESMACPACKADSKRRHGDEIPIGGLK